MPTPFTEETLTGEVLHHWTIQEYEQHERNRRWLIIMFLLGFGLVAVGLFTQNFLFSLIIILFGIILYLQANQDPIQVDFAITELGVVVGGKFYAWKEFKEFYIIYNPPYVKSLYIETKSFFRPLLRVPLLDMNPVDVRHTLREYMDENLEKEDEPMSEMFARNWRIH